MALLCANGTRTASGPNRMFSGVTTVAGAHRFQNIGVPHTHLNFASGEHSVSGVTNRSSVPQGARHPVAYKWPRKSGGLASHGEIAGLGSLIASGVLGKNASADLSGAGTLSNAALGLIVGLVAALTGSGEISDADLKAFLALAADLSGAGAISDAELGALGWLLAALSGDGEASAAGLTALGTLAADIRSYGDLTPEGLRDAVWNAVAASYDAPGTMGELMNTGAAGLTAQQVWEYATRTLTTSSGLTVEQATQLLEIFQRLGLDPTKPLLQTATEISTDDWTLAVTEGVGTVTVERQ